METVGKTPRKEYLSCPRDETRATSTTVVLGFDIRRPISRFTEEEIPVPNTGCAESHICGPVRYATRYATTLLSQIKHLRQKKRDYAHTIQNVLYRRLVYAISVRSLGHGGGH